MRTTSELRSTMEELGDNAMAADKRLARVTVENTTLSKSLAVKERLIEELHRHVLQREAEANELKIRFNSTEKENAYLRKEYNLLVKELEVQNVEMEYYRRSIDESHMQHLENLQKISRLEAECQRLQRIAKKKQFGSAPFAKVNSEVAVSGRDKTQLRGRSSSTFPHECLSSCLEKLRAVEEENNALKGLLDQKTAELQSSRTVFSRTGVRLSQVEAQGTGGGSNKNMELATCEIAMDSDLCSEVSSLSWANALITELDHFKGEKMRNQVNEAERAAKMSLMDDFVEVEKLAMLSFHEPNDRDQDHLAVFLHPDCAAGNQMIITENTGQEGPFDWLQVVMNAVKKQESISKRSIPELVQDISIALNCFYQNKGEEKTPSTQSCHLESSEKKVNDLDPSQAISNLSKLILRIEEIAQMEDGISSQTDNKICAFHWKLSELNSAVERLVSGCSGLDSGKTNIGNFVQDLHTTLEWVLSNYMTSLQLETSFSLQLESQKDMQIKEFKEMFANQLETQKIINEDISSQLVCAQAELKESVQKLLSLEIELDDRKNRYEELEADCLDLQLVLESIQQKEPPHHDLGDTDKKTTKEQEDLSKDTLTGCQETKPDVVGKELSTFVEGSKLDTNGTSNRSYTKRFSLRDQLIAEDTGRAIILRASSGHARTSSFRDSNGGQLLLVRSPYPYADSKSKKGDAVIGALVVPGKKEGFSLLRKLIVRKKKAPKVRGGR